MDRVKKNKKKGFTLVELMIVVVIMVILAAAATPIFKGYLDRAKEARYLAECRTVYVAAQTTVQDWVSAEKDLPNTDTNPVEITSTTPKNAETLKDFGSDIQRLAQVASAGTYKVYLNADTESCAKVEYENNNTKVTFEPDKSAIQVVSSEAAGG